ncbi:acyl carrier protein [Streptosporangiaceae bacterium NEAU-GS5]|nr:acyl carrier protein [Streptosporangiaceae bacterium NEAU-GS5]
MATLEEIRVAFPQIVNEIAGVPVAEVQLDKAFSGDLDIDSLSMVEIMVAAEERFGVKIPDDQLNKLVTVNEVVDYIHSQAA